MLVLLIFIFGVARVCASDVNDTILASEDTNQMDLSSNNEITEDNLKTSEENITLTQTNNAESNLQILSESEGTYYDIIDEIGAVEIDIWKEAITAIPVETPLKSQLLV